MRPFVYRRYLDFGVFESLREMKALIEREVERRELADNIKLGPGGIREIEFIVQALQLIRGGRDARLQTASLPRRAAAAGGARLLPEAAVRELGAAYEFLRRLENRLQMLADEQTHPLPADAAPARARRAGDGGARLGSAASGELDAHRARVSGHFRAGDLRRAVTPTEPTVRIDLGRFWDTQARDRRARRVAGARRLRRQRGSGAPAAGAARLLARAPAR